MAIIGTEEILAATGTKLKVKSKKLKVARYQKNRNIFCCDLLHICGDMDSGQANRGFTMVRNIYGI